MKSPGEKNGYKELPHHPKDGFKQASALRTPLGGRSSCMQKLSLLKGRTLIGLLLIPHGKDDANPDVCQCTNRHAVTFALGAFALIIRLGPRFLLGREPGKLMQSVAQRFETGKAHMDRRVLPAFPGHRTGSSQRLDAPCLRIPAAIISPLGQQPGSQALAGTGQALKDLAVGMRQKKASDRLVVLSNLFDQRQELLHQCQGKPRFGARRDVISLQLRLAQDGDDLGGSLGWVDVSSFFQGGFDLCRRSGLSGLRSRIGLQKHQRGALLYFVEELQCCWIVRLEAGGELVYQAGLPLISAS